MSVKYIADLHLYDSYSFDWRPQFRNLDDYWRHLEYTWNSSITADDTVIIVGDIGHPCDQTVRCLKSLQGKKVLVLGNHDSIWGNRLYDKDLFTGVYPYLQQADLYVCHIPDSTVRNCYQIHGHHHRYDLPGMQNELKLYASSPLRLNCSADLVGNKPMSIQELIVNKEVYLDACAARGLI